MRTSYLDLEIYSDDLNQTLTLREYFKKLLITLWEEEESFSGKRPFGNSGWQYDVYKSLILTGKIYGEIDEDGYISVLDEHLAKQFIIENIIKEL